MITDLSFKFPQSSSVLLVLKSHVKHKRRNINAHCTKQTFHPVVLIVLYLWTTSNCQFQLLTYLHWTSCDPASVVSKFDPRVKWTRGPRVQQCWHVTETRSKKRNKDPACHMNTMVTHVVAEAADADILNKILKFKYVKDDIYYIIVGVCGSVRPSIT